MNTKIRPYTPAKSRFSLWIKNSCDRIFATLALIVAAPILIGVAIAIYVTMGKPILFRQLRPGQNGRIFNVYKFRTMTTLKNLQRQDSDSNRITHLGKFLRATSLDELPQLWNIAKGDMSFVGPRPLLIEYLVHYDAEQARRQSVKPGITGWAQTHGRNSISWDEKFRLDLWYVNHWSIWLDLRILLLTVVKVFRQEGINQDQATSMPIFRGNAVPAKSQK